MTTYSVNKGAVAKAEELIDARQYDLHGDWSSGAPTAQDGNAQIERHGWDGYGEWYLGIDEEANEDTKDRYGFPYGNYSRVMRAALIHAKQRAAQNGHTAVEQEASRLLERLDAKRS
jgi:hypothetical protein